MAQKWTYRVEGAEGDHASAVQNEIDDFLAAVSSYPARCAKEPSITFEDHLYAIITLRENRPPFYYEN